MRDDGAQQPSLALMVRKGIHPPERNEAVWRKPARAFRYYWIQLLRLRGSPFVLARGVAIGVFIGLTPTIPFHTVLILICCATAKAQPVAGCIASLLVSNPLTIPLHYWAAWKAGTVVTGSSISWDHVRTIMNLARDANMLDAADLATHEGFRVLGSLLLGGIVIALPFAVASYFAALRLYVTYQKRRQRRLLKTYSSNDSGSEKTTFTK
jgi:uncharacterized protein (DUF2062 family)